ncbi:MAG: 2-oxoacid:acceptor oxidoreductase family protein [Bdellovibrionales bacterium]|nr:2-oxoacid:acceptor oxidoreductase family protein [Bdellovibrionales bacterium]
MFQVRFHGRGGQGAVTAAELLSVAAFNEGNFAQAFPSFGSERMGAPVASFCRISDKEIRLREPIEHPDILLVLDPTLLHHVPIFEGASENAQCLINSTHSVNDLGLGQTPVRLLHVPASAIARDVLGVDRPNTALLGGLAALCESISLSAIQDAIRSRFTGEIGEKNCAVAQKAYAYVKAEVGDA